jgi:RNA polymerase sigma factor (sigma-70 family)
MTQGASDEELMLKYASQGDTQAFDQLVLRHQAAVGRYLWHLCGDQEIARDIAQDAWERILKAAKRYQPTAKFKTYLYTVINNLAIDHVRSLSRRPAEVSLSDDDGALEAGDIPSLDSPPEDVVERDQMRQALQSAIQGLPFQQRQVSLLFLEDLDLHEIASVVGREFETVKSQWRYGIKKLSARTAKAKSPV